MYINFMIEENKNIYISSWLLLITILVAIMIIVGGLTRLTDSGLSITRWDLFTGIIPPLTFDDWSHAFFLYKQIPEFKLLNSEMTLNEFKYIYWWEYIHRLLGRIVGLFYILPLLFFTLKKKINNKKLITFYFIFLLICLQGFVGWYMVKSGLIERTDVSHYRLSMHLTLAFIIYIFLYWNFLDYKNIKKTSFCKKIPFNLPIIFLFLLLIQISVGAFVSGLDAGRIYQTWPLMNNAYFPDDSSIQDLFHLKMFSVPSLVQFTHRNLAYLIFLLFLIIIFITFIKDEYKYLRKIVGIIFILLIFQIFLGILTVLSGASLIVASMHQIGSIILISASLILVYRNLKN